MSTTYGATGLRQTTASTRRAFSFFRKYWSALQERRERRLSVLSDGEPIDIGTTRGEIDYVASNRSIDPRGIRSAEWVRYLPTVDGQIALFQTHQYPEVDLRYPCHQKNSAREFEQAMTAFQIQPDWYEEYWLKPKKASPSGLARWWRWNLASYSILCAAKASVLVAFIRTERIRRRSMRARMHWQPQADIRQRLSISMRRRTDPQT